MAGTQVDYQKLLTFGTVDEPVLRFTKQFEDVPIVESASLRKNEFVQRKLLASKFSQLHLRGAEDGETTGVFKHLTKVITENPDADRSVSLVEVMIFLAHELMSACFDLITDK